MKKLLLVDGNSLVFRAFYATMRQPMTSKSGQPTNAVFGFSNMLTKAIDLISPDYCLVAFDTGKKTFRHEQFEDYKGTRKPLDEALISQFPLVREFLDAMPLKRFELEGYEADDIIGTLSTRYPGVKKVILTSDRDMLQLISDEVTVLLMKKGITEMAEMETQALRDEYDLEPKQIIELKSLMGDTADNIPGVPGVGEKTALKLLGEFNTLDGVYENIESIKGKLKEKLINNKESAYLSRMLATIDTNVEFLLELSDCEINIDEELLSKFYRKYDMNTLSKRLSFDSVSTSLDTGSLSIDIMSDELVKDDVIVSPIITNKQGYNSEIEGYLVSDSHKVAYVGYDQAPNDTAFKRLIEGNYTKQAVHLKELYHHFKKQGIEYDSFVDDLGVLAYLVDSSLSSIEKIKDTHDLWFRDLEPMMAEAMFIKSSKQLFDNYKEQLVANNGTDLYEDIEFPLIEVLVEMEVAGIDVDKEVLNQFSVDTQAIVDRLSASIYEKSNKEFNINSPKQLAEVLFDDLGLKSGKKRSTAVDVLEKLIDKHPIIPEILEYRKYQKFLSTYADGLQKYIDEDGKIHTTFSQTVAQTGRLSSLDPNLQNISVRDEETKKVRKVFIAKEGYKLLSCDYSQIELRVLAHMANEPFMIESFNSKSDIHTQTAMKVFDLADESEVTSLHRRQAKAVNFGIVYGISDFGLAQQLDIPPKQANEFIANYLETFAGIEGYMQEVVNFTKQHGYAETLYHRRRQIPEINDKNFVVKERAKRAAMNSPIQGTAADLIKIAMIQVRDNLLKMKAESQLILQVHDELLLLVKEEELDKVTKMVVETMQSVAKLKVPLEVSCEIGNNWYEV